MLFHDPSCRAETTLRENRTRGIYDVCQLDWVAICTKSNHGSFQVDGQLNLTGIDQAEVDCFLSQYGPQFDLTEETLSFRQGDYYFWKIPIRTDENYYVFSLYCKRGAPLSGDNLAWLRIYSSLKYEYTLLNNESIQERDLSENIVDSIDSAIVVMDLDRIVISANRNVEKIFGLNHSDFLGQDFIHFTSGRFRQSYLDTFAQVTQLGTKRTLRNMVFQKHDMEQIINITLSPLRNSKGQIAGAVMVGNDITELHYMEHEVQQNKQFTILGQVAAGLAHDVKNPLMNITACTRALQRNTQLSAEHMEILSIILHESDRINTVIEQMLSFGNVEQLGKQMSLNLNELLTNCIQIINRQKSAKDIKITPTLDPRVPILSTDSSGIHQAFLNILINSVDAITHSGSIAVSSRLRSDGRIEIRIADNGSGIPEERMGRLFTPYYSTKLHSGGSGLGLFLAKRVFDQHGASITVTSQEHVGTEVCVVFSPVPPLPEYTKGKEVQ